MWGKNQILVGTQIYPGEPGTIWASIHKWEWLYTVSPQLIDFLGVSTLAHVSNKLDSEREILQLNWEDCHIDHIVPLAAFNGAILFAVILNVSCVSGRGACQSSITCYKPASTFCSWSLDQVPEVRSHCILDWLIALLFSGSPRGNTCFWKEVMVLCISRVVVFPASGVSREHGTTRKQRPVNTPHEKIMFLLGCWNNKKTSRSFCFFWLQFTLAEGR